MSRVRLLEPQQASEEAGNLLKGIQAKLGRLPNMHKVMANSNAALAAYISVGESLEKGNLSAQIREQIALAVAEFNGCQYCLAAHTAIGKSLGLSQDEIIDNRRGSSSTQSVSSILTFVKLLLSNRGRISDEDMKRMRIAGFDEGQILEIITIVAINIFTNYLNLVSETPVDFPKVAELPSVA